MLVARKNIMIYSCNSSMSYKTTAEPDNTHLVCHTNYSRDYTVNFYPRENHDSAGVEKSSFSAILVKSRNFRGSCRKIGGFQALQPRLQL